MPEKDITVQQIYDEILKNRNDIKNCIEASETRLLLRIEELRSHITNLEKENQLLKKEVELLKVAQNRNNIVVFGLNKKQEDIIPQNICTTLNNLLEVELKVSDIDDGFPLGKTDNCPIKIQFLTHQVKKNILQNCRKLKGKNISISHDLTKKQQLDNKILRKHLFLAKQEYKSCFIRGNRLFVDGTSYGVEDLTTEDCLAVAEVDKPKSAPATPTLTLPPPTNSPITEKVTIGKEKEQSTPKSSNNPRKTVQNIPSVINKPRTRSVK